MSVFDRKGLAFPGSVDNSDGQARGSSSLTSVDLMGGEDGSSAALPVAADLDPHRHARDLVRLVQCQQCSLPLRQPLTLSCGNSICRRCLPETHKRENITYPMSAGRSEGFICPLEDCGQEHSLADCSQDVTLAKVLDRVSIEVVKTRPLTSNTPTQLDERLRWKNSVDSSKLTDAPHSRVLSGGRLVATYTMAELGELKYNSEVSYQPQPPAYDTYQHLDLAMLEHLREVTRNELDCHLCYALLLDPVTTTCGHTYCRKCVARVIDHSQLCPECRRPLHMSPVALGDAPANKRLSKFLLAFCADALASRAEAVEAEEAALAESRWVPLFVCTLAYPQIPTFLHVFEPRYRLMIRRALETDRKFGMLTYNGRGEVQGELGRTQFMRYGTMLEIVNLQLFDDGRSLIETRGVSRFRVTDHGMRDGYVIGRVERVDDISLTEEEALEASEVAAGNPVPVPHAPIQNQASSHPSASPPAATTTQGPVNANDPRPLTALTTSELMEIGMSFIERMHASSAPWLARDTTAAYGEMSRDPAIFPYWFASVLPIDDAEKYRLLETRSVRQRLQICVEWVRRVERMRW